MKTSDFDFDLPEELIAQDPLPHRDASRLLRLPLSGDALEHGKFRDLPELLREGDLLVLNDARVIPARLVGAKEETGGKVELLLTDPLPPLGDRAVWRCMATSSKPLQPRGRLRFGDLRAEVVEVEGEGFLRVAFDLGPDDLLERIETIGAIPLPPYMRRAPDDLDARRYQTIFARRKGAVAAPTAGLHFTEDLFDSLRRRGVRIETLTLYVGPGTFLPVRADDVEDHRMHEERYEVPLATSRAIREVREAGGRVVAVGTTALRALETACAENGDIPPGPGASRLFIYPGYRFRAVDGLLTNFHLPRSTLLMLVSALAGRERLLAAYREAVERKYRFYSYGDAMLLL